MSTIECILHGSLEDALPEDHPNNRALIEFDSAPSVNDILEKLDIDREFLQFVLADGRYIELEYWSSPVKAKLFQFWPRISGG